MDGPMSYDPIIPYLDKLRDDIAKAVIREIYWTAVAVHYGDLGPVDDGWEEFERDD